MFNLFHSNRRGFSLIELMIVVAIISMLVGVGIPQYSKFRQKAHDSEAKTSLSALFTAQRSFHGEYNFYHTSLQALGYGVEGKHFFNVGFGTQTAVNPIDFGFYPVVDNTIMSTKQICTGTNGTGTDTSCWFVVDVPDLPAETTSTLNTFVAAAVSTPSTYAQNGSFDQMNMIAENVFSANLAQAASPPPTTDVIDCRRPDHQHFSVCIDNIDCTDPTQKPVCATDTYWPPETYILPVTTRVWTINGEKIFKTTAN